MSFKGIDVSKLQGGLGRRDATTDNVFGLVMGGVVATGLALATPAKLIQLQDAVNLGIDAAYDSANDVLVYHHISEFFRLCPSGTLWIMLVAQDTDQAAIADKANQHLLKLLLHPAANREIKYAGIVANPDNDVAAYPTPDTGVTTDVLAAVPKAQELIDYLISEFNYYVDGVLIEGRDIHSTVAIGSLKDLRTLESPNVSVVIGADKDILDDNTGYAAVGSALGMLAVRKVSECLGSVDIARKPEAKRGNPYYSMTDTANALWLTAALSSGKLFAELTKTERQALTDKGFIYAGFQPGYPGMYFSDSPVCDLVSGDYAYIENNRTWNKAARYAITALIPKINSEVDIDGTTGYLTDTTISDWTNAVNREVENMLKDGEISSFEVYINPEQNVLSGSPIVVSLTIVPKGIARSITAEIGFTNPLNA